MMPITRREFLHSGAAAVALRTTRRGLLPATNPLEAGESFASYQERRRKELWSLLGTCHGSTGQKSQSY